MMQSNWLYWEWSLLVLDVDNGIEAEDGIWYLCSISIVSIDHWPVDIQSPACSQRYLLCLLDSRKRRFFISSCFLDMLLIIAGWIRVRFSSERLTRGVDICRSRTKTVFDQPEAGLEPVRSYSNSQSPVAVTIKLRRRPR